MIVDEVHNFKNPKSAGYIAVMGLRERSRCLIGLTGTPLQNNFDELHSLLALCTRARVGTLSDFKTMFKPIERGEVGGSRVVCLTAHLGVGRGR